MKLKALFLIVGTALLAIVALNSFSLAAAAPPAATPDASTAHAILHSTVQIALYESAGDAGVEAGGRGLGTLVRRNGQTLIITHDHWTHITANLSAAEFRDADGALLLSLSAEAFQSLIRHRDGGTLVLAAPAELTVLPAAMLDAPVESADESDVVWVVRRARSNGGGTLEVVAASVQGVEVANGVQRLRLRGADGAVVLPGDSGGGVWLGGRFVGNVWSGGLEVRRTLLGRLLGASHETETNLILAALLPGQPGPEGGAFSPQPTTASGMRNLPEW